MITIRAMIARRMLIRRLKLPIVFDCIAKVTKTSRKVKRVSRFSVDVDGVYLVVLDL